MVEKGKIVNTCTKGKYERIVVRRIRIDVNVRIIKQNIRILRSRDTHFPKELEGRKGLGAGRSVPF